MSFFKAEDFYLMLGTDPSPFDEAARIANAKLRERNEQRDEAVEEAKELLKMSSLMNDDEEVGTISYNHHLKCQEWLKKYGDEK